MSMSITRLLVGRSIPNREAEGEKIGVFEGVPAMGLDGFGSAAYGPEAALSILVAAGAAGLSIMVPITGVVLLLLVLLYASYRQTIAAYPSNGGSYVVAKENLGTGAGLLAAAALMLDYMLNVAVGISAGIGALTSAVPSLHAYTLPLCLAVLAFLTLVNLRGTRETGLFLSAPTYLFVLSLGGMVAWGAVKVWLGDGHPQPVIAPPPIPPGSDTLGLWLMLRAFASGCTAMTGVEAVSNGVGSFRDPRVKAAHGTLTVIVVVLGVLLLGIAHVTQSYGIMAMDQPKDGYQSVLSQLVDAVYGRGWLYFVTIGSVLVVLCLSANTSFVGFPRLCHLVAQDGFLPRPFAMPGRRLVYSVGILFLSICSAVLLVVFGGITDRLIPLFAVGAFLSFTLSQAGMAMHWWRAKGRRSSQSLRLAVNGAGALATGVALVVILLAKFTEGAWLTVLIIPAALLTLRRVRRFYADVDRRLLRGSNHPINVHNHAQAAAIVPIERWDRLSRKAVEYALCLTPDVTAMHVTTMEGPEGEDRAKSLQGEWDEYVRKPAAAAGLTPPELTLVPSQYRSVVAPLLREIEEFGKRFPGRRLMIVLPELIEGKWWGYVMHTHRERYLRERLLQYGGPELTVVSVPWQLQPERPEKGVAQEES